MCVYSSKSLVSGLEGHSRRSFCRLREILEACSRDAAIGEMVSEAQQLGADAVIGVDVDYEPIQMGQGAVC